MIEIKRRDVCVRGEGGMGEGKEGKRERERGGRERERDVC